jgi:hypothetical protein
MAIYEEIGLFQPMYSISGHNANPVSGSFAEKQQRKENFPAACLGPKPLPSENCEKTSIFHDSFADCAKVTVGLVEVFIWIVVVSQVVKNVHSLPAYFGYAAGFAVGMKIEDRLALGTLIIRIILLKDGEVLARRLREAGYGVTVANGMGSSGEVKLIFTAIPAKTWS